MKRLVYVISILGTCFFASCQKDIVITNSEYRPHEIVRTKSDAEMTKAVNSFSFDLLKKSYVTNKNTLFSPASLSMALSMLADGADGITFNEIRSVLGYSEMTVDDIDAYNEYLLSYLQSVAPEASLIISNSIWLNNGFPVKESYASQMNRFYDAPVESLDLGSDDAENRINGWCNEKTKGLIPDIFKKDSKYQMVLLNALYFSADWAYYFVSGGSIPFKDENNTITGVSSFSGKVDVPYYKNDRFQMIKIPLADKGYSFTIYLPSENISLENALKSIDAKKWGNYESNLASTQVDVHIPIFNIEQGDDIVELLKQLGMGHVFEPSASFPYLSETQGHFNNVIHKTKIGVSEKGVEAAAVTEITRIIGLPADGLTGDSDTPKFIANRPFIFTIEENDTGVILFAGVKSAAN